MPLLTDEDIARIKAESARKAEEGGPSARKEMRSDALRYLRLQNGWQGLVLARLEERTHSLLGPTLFLV